MLKIISLHTIKEIFETEALGQLSPMAKMSYISCLMYWFEDMPPDLDSTEAFDIVKAQIKSYDKNHRYFMEMELAGLVKINDQTITFINHWHRHIDRQLLNKPSPEVYLGTCELQPATHFESDLKSNRSTFELLDMRHKIKPPQVVTYMDEFIKESVATSAKYLNAALLIKHFLNWVNKKVQFAPKPGAAGSGKILGV